MRRRNWYKPATHTFVGEAAVIMRDIVIKRTPAPEYLLSFEDTHGTVLDIFQEKAIAMRMARALSRKGDRTVLGTFAKGSARALCFKYKGGALIYDGGCCPTPVV
jgi:hypothetical protein